MLSEQITLLEALHLSEISVHELMAPSASLDASSPLKLATSWWNKVCR